MELGQPIPASFSSAIFASPTAIGTDAEVERVREQISNIESEGTRVTSAIHVWISCNEASRRSDSKDSENEFKSSSEFR